jgi:acyl carrier protein
MKEENISKLKEIFMEVFELSESQVVGYRKINNRKWDSLATVTLIAAIESEFNILTDESVYEGFTSFSAVELVLDEKGL